MKIIKKLLAQIRSKTYVRNQTYVTINMADCAAIPEAGTVILQMEKGFLSQIRIDEIKKALAAHYQERSIKMPVFIILDSSIGVTVIPSK